MHNNCLRFLLEPLEPRRLFDSALLVDAAADEGREVIVSAPATIIENAQSSSGADHYLFRAEAGALYDFRLSTDGKQHEVGLHDPKGYQYFNNAQPNQLLLRAPVDGLYPLFVWTEKPADYTLTITELPSDAFDPASVPLISPGVTSEEFTAPDQFQWYRFTASAAARYTFKTNLQTLTNSTLRIVGSDGVSELTQNDFNNTRDPAAFVQWVAPTSGNYYVEVGGYSAGTFDLVMTEEIDDQGGQPAHIEAPTSIHGTLDHRADEDDFLFDATPGYLYIFHPAADSIFTTLRLANADGLKAMVDTTQYWHPRYTWYEDEYRSIVWSPSQAGTYQLQLSHDVSRDVGDSSPIGSYAIDVDLIPLTVPPADAPPISAGPVDLQDTSSLSWFRFEATKESLYSFAVPTDNLDGYVSRPFFQVVAADGTVLGDNNLAFSERDLGDSVLHSVAPSSGTYYLRVARADSSLHTFIMLEQADDQAGETPAVTLPVTIRGSIDYGTRSGIGDVDLYRFNATADTSYIVAPLGSEIQLRILDANLSRIADQPRYRPDFSGYFADARWSAPETGTYYLQVMGEKLRRGRSSGPFSIYLAQAPADDRAISARLGVGNTLDDEIRYPGDIRQITIEMHSRGKYRISGSLPPQATLNLGNDCQDYCLDDWRAANSAGQVSFEEYLYNGAYTLEIFTDTPGPIHLLLEPVNSDSSPATDENDGQDEQDVSDDEESGGDEQIDDPATDPYAVDDSVDVYPDALDADGEFFSDSTDPLDSIPDDVW